MGHIYTKLQLFTRNSKLAGYPVFNLANLVRLELKTESFMVIEKKIEVIGEETEMRKWIEFMNRRQQSPTAGGTEIYPTIRAAAM